MSILGFALGVGAVSLVICLLLKPSKAYLERHRECILRLYRLDFYQTRFFLCNRSKMYIEAKFKNNKILQGILWIDSDGLLNIQSGGKVTTYTKSSGTEDFLKLVKCGIVKIYRYSVIEKLLKEGYVVGV